MYKLYEYMYICIYDLIWNTGIGCIEVAYTLHNVNYPLAGNFRYFRDYPTSHEIFHPRIFSRLLTSFAYRASGVTKFTTTKINSEDPRQLLTKICAPENDPLYGVTAAYWVH